MGFQSFEELQRALPVLVHEINSTPRKSLAGFTPDDVFFGVEMGREVLSLQKANEQLDRETWEHINKLLQEERALMRDQVFEAKEPDRMTGAPAQFVKGDLVFVKKELKRKKKHIVYRNHGPFIVDEQKGWRVTYWNHEGEKQSIFLGNVIRWVPGNDRPNSSDNALQIVSAGPISSYEIPGLTPEKCNVANCSEDVFIACPDCFVFLCYQHRESRCTDHLDYKNSLQEDYMLALALQKEEQDSVANERELRRLNRGQIRESSLGGLFVDESTGYCEDPRRLQGE